MKNRKMTHRVLSLALALLLCAGLALSLASCGSKEAAPNTEWTSADTDAPTYFARILPLDASAREMFTAASRGYDMSGAGFDDANLPEPDPSGVSLSGAIAALEKLRPAGDASKVEFDADIEEMKADPVGVITLTVEKMKTAVALENDNGPIDTLLVWIGKFLQILTKITASNYVLALFVFAVIVELLMLPFGIKQQKNSVKQARMRPKEMAIRKKYAGRNDQVSQRKMQEEVQKLYQEEGFNPMGGCLPLLIQLPIVLALYQIVIDPLHYVLNKAAGLSSALTTYCTTARAAGGLGQSLTNSRGTIELLSKFTNDGISGLSDFAYFSNAAEVAAQVPTDSIPNFNLFGVNMGLIPGFHAPWGLILVPIVTFLAYFASMKINRKLSYQPATTDPQMGCSNNVMDITMPLMSVYIAFIVPAAVGIYWIFKSVITVLKQFILHKAMPLPVFTEEEYKAAEKEMKGKSKPEKRAAGERVTKSGAVVRSLHHIDDDDEMLPPPVKEPEEPEEAEKSEEKSDEPANGMAAPLKEDRKNNDNKN